MADSLGQGTSIQIAVLQQLTLINKTLGQVFPKVTGSVTLGAAVTTTAVSNSSASTGSRIFVQATNAAARTLGAVAVTGKSTGSFVLTTASSAGGETYDYFIVNSV